MLEENNLMENLKLLTTKSPMEKPLIKNYIQKKNQNQHIQISGQINPPRQQYQQKIKEFNNTLEKLNMLAQDLEIHQIVEKQIEENDTISEGLSEDKQSEQSSRRNSAEINEYQEGQLQNINEIPNKQQKNNDRIPQDQHKHSKKSRPSSSQQRYNLNDLENIQEESDSFNSSTALNFNQLSSTNNLNSSLLNSNRILQNDQNNQMQYKINYKNQYSNIQQYNEQQQQMMTNESQHQKKQKKQIINRAAVVQIQKYNPYFKDLSHQQQRDLIHDTKQKNHNGGSIIVLNNNNNNNHSRLNKTAIQGGPANKSQTNLNNSLNNIDQVRLPKLQQNDKANQRRADSLGQYRLPPKPQNKNHILNLQQNYNNNNQIYQNANHNHVRSKSFKQNNENLPKLMKGEDLINLSSSQHKQNSANKTKSHSLDTSFTTKTSNSTTQQNQNHVEPCYNANLLLDAIDEAELLEKLQNQPLNINKNNKKQVSQGNYSTEPSISKIEQTSYNISSSSNNNIFNNSNDQENLLQNSQILQFSQLVPGIKIENKSQTINKEHQQTQLSSQSYQVQQNQQIQTQQSQMKGIMSSSSIGQVNDQIQKMELITDTNAIQHFDMSDNSIIQQIQKSQIIIPTFKSQIQQLNEQNQEFFINAANKKKIDRPQSPLTHSEKQKINFIEHVVNGFQIQLAINKYYNIPIYCKLLYENSDNNNMVQNIYYQNIIQVDVDYQPAIQWKFEKVLQKDKKKNQVEISGINLENNEKRDFLFIINLNQQIQQNDLENIKNILLLGYLQQKYNNPPCVNLLSDIYLLSEKKFIRENLDISIQIEENICLEEIIQQRISQNNQNYLEEELIQIFKDLLEQFQILEDQEGIYHNNINLNNIAFCTKSSKYKFKNFQKAYFFKQKQQQENINDQNMQIFKNYNDYFMSPELIKYENNNNNNVNDKLNNEQNSQEQKQQQQKAYLTSISAKAVNIYCLGICFLFMKFLFSEVQRYTHYIQQKLENIKIENTNLISNQIIVQMTHEDPASREKIQIKNLLEMLKDQKIQMPFDRNYINQKPVNSNVEKCKQMDEICMFYEKTFQWKEVLTIQQSLVEQKKNMFGQKNLDYLNSLNSLWKVNLMLNNLKQAYPLCQQYFELIGQIDDKLIQKEKISDDFNFAGLLKWKMNKYEEALEDYQFALNLKEEIFGQDSFEACVQLNSLGIVQQQIGDLENAEFNYATVEFNLRKNLKPQHELFYANILSQLAGVVSLDENRLLQALGMFQQTYEIKKKILQENDFSFAKAAYNLAIIYFKLQMFEECQKKLHKMIIIKEQFKNFDPAEIVPYRTLLANVLIKQQKIHEAQQVLIYSVEEIIVYNQVKKLKEKLQALAEYGTLLEAANDFERAKQFFYEAFKLSEEKLGSTNKFTKEMHKRVLIMSESNKLPQEYQKILSSRTKRNYKQTSKIYK